MTRAEKTMAARLLDMAAAEFHEHGCNDAPEELFDDIAPRDLKDIEKRFNSWDGRRCKEDYTPYHLIGDDEWMEFFAARLGE